MSYLTQKQTIAKVDARGKVLGKIDKWDAHRKGILHRGFSVILVYKNKYILQHRKHPVFDGYFDLTSSSHPVFERDKLQTVVDAAHDCLKREWGISENDLVGKIKESGEIYYKAKDPSSIYTEHEKCSMLVAEIKELPTPDWDFAYGFSLVTREELRSSAISKKLCPWSQKAVSEDSLDL